MPAHEAKQCTQKNKYPQSKRDHDGACGESKSRSGENHGAKKPRQGFVLEIIFAVPDYGIKHERVRGAGIQRITRPEAFRVHFLFQVKLS